MHRKELPIVIRLSQLELAQALGQPDDSAVQQLGGLAVVLHPIEVEPEHTAPTDLIGAIGGPPALRALAAAFRPVEQAVFRRLKANPELARRFVLNPAGALAELGLAPPTCQAEVSSASSAAAPPPTASTPTDGTAKTPRSPSLRDQV